MSGPPAPWSRGAAIKAGLIVGGVAAVWGWVNNPMPHPLIGLAPSEFMAGKVIAAASSVLFSVIFALLIRWVRNKGARL